MDELGGVGREVRGASAAGGEGVVGMEGWPWCEGGEALRAARVALLFLLAAYALFCSGFGPICWLACGSAAAFVASLLLGVVPARTIA